jgi:hypothetical protein
VPLGDEVQIAQVQFGSQAEKLGMEQGFKVTASRCPPTAGQGVDVHAALLLLGAPAWWNAQAKGLAPTSLERGRPPRRPTEGARPESLR